MFRPNAASRVLALMGLALIGGAGATVEERLGTTTRDPTQPPPGGRVAGPVVKQTAAVPELSSVLIGANRRLAVIDGRVMAEGEERAGVKVWKINTDRVVVSIAGREPVTLLLDKAQVHKEIR